MSDFASLAVYPKSNHNPLVLRSKNSPKNLDPAYGYRFLDFFEKMHLDL